MRKVFVFAVLLQLFAMSGAAQSGNSAPIEWKRYQVAERRISAEFPKLPVVMARPTGCSDLEKRSYFAYAAEAVYELTIAAKPKQVQAGCVIAKKFNEALLIERLTEIRSKSGLEEATGFEDGRQVYRFSGLNETRWIYADLKQQRWVEIAVTHRDDVNTGEQRFFASLKFDDNRGQEIGAGALTTVGDDGVELVTEPATVKDPNKDRIRIVAKPLAMYTDKARKTKTKGTVTLRIEFLANGSVGDIELVKGLPNGLSENAIDAAKKMVFLPSRLNGKPVNTKLTVQYGFNIY